MPAIQRYNKRLRAIKEIRRMLDELNNTKSQWENSVHRYRNTQLIKRFSNQLRKLNKYERSFIVPKMKNLNKFYIFSLKSGKMLQRWITRSKYH